MKLLEHPSITIETVTTPGLPEGKIFGFTYRKPTMDFTIAGRHRWMPIKVVLESDDNIEIGVKYNDIKIVSGFDKSYELVGYAVLAVEGTDETLLYADSYRVIG